MSKQLKGEDIVVLPVEIFEQHGTAQKYVESLLRENALLTVQVQEFKNVLIKTEKWMSNQSVEDIPDTAYLPVKEMLNWKPTNDQRKKIMSASTAIVEEVATIRHNQYGEYALEINKQWLLHCLPRLNQDAEYSLYLAKQDALTALPQQVKSE